MLFDTRIRVSCRTKILAVVAICAFPIRMASAQGNSVVVESVGALPGKTGVMVGVYVSNTEPITTIVLPLEARSLDSEAHYNAWSSFGLTPTGRMNNSPLGILNPSGLPGEVLSQGYGFMVQPPCSGPISHTWGGQSHPPGTILPGAYLFVAYSAGLVTFEDIDLDPGSEIPGLDTPSCQLVFDLTNAPGQFVIDTCCIKPVSHLVFVGIVANSIPVDFTPGIITIGCFCRCHGDPECDGYHDILDVVRAINTAFRGVPEPLDQDCTRSRTDVDASGVTDVLDVAKMIDVVLNDGQPEVNFTDPCAGL